MQLKKLVVGIDFSPGSDAALEEACVLAKRHGSELVLVHATGISELTMVELEQGRNAEQWWAKRVREREQAGKDGLEKLRARCSEAGADVTAHLVGGYPDEALLKAAAEVGADLVVVGTRGTTGISRLLLGSVAEAVVRQSEHDVLVVRQRDEPAEAGFRKVLVPTDFSPTAERGAVAATQILAPGGSLELLHCWQLPYSGGGVFAPGFGYPSVSQEAPEVQAVRAEVRSRAESEANAIIERDCAGVEAVELTITEAGAAEGIAARLENDAFDAVVIGSHGRRGVRRLLLGSVAERTLRNTPCSILVCKPPHDGD
jgi:nucleotide-binding universal stress UspA family protein